MGLTFDPPLDVVTHVTPESGSSLVVLNFTAALDYDQHLQPHDGFQIQLWSDLPIDNRPAGQWGETALKDQLAASTSALLDLVPIEPKENHDAFFHARVFLPLTDNKQFSYTYRLVYPSGEIRWLGQFRQNGQVIVNTKLNADTSCFSLAKGWFVLPDGSALWGNETNDSFFRPVEIGELKENIHYDIWLVDETG